VRKLSIEEIEVFSGRTGVRRIAVENFLMSMGTNDGDALGNLELDTRLYKWDKKTWQAIFDGILQARKK